MGPTDRDKDTHEVGAPVVTVVRTESQLARFNTARALFEKLGVFDDKVKERSASSERCSSRVNSESSRTSYYSSRSPSPPTSPTPRYPPLRSPSPAPEPTGTAPGVINHST